MKTQMQNVLLELSFAKLTIKLLQKEINTTEIPEHVNTDRLHMKYCEQN